MQTALSLLIIPPFHRQMFEQPFKNIDDISSRAAEAIRQFDQEAAAMLDRISGLLENGQEQSHV